MMTSKEAAAFLRVSKWQLIMWRTGDSGRGPRYTRLGRRKLVRYFKSDLIEFAKTRGTGANQK